MRKLIIIRGLPGAGKTTFAKFLFENLDNSIDLTIAAADDFFYDEAGKYNFDRNQLYNAHLSCQQNVEIAMERHWELRQEYLNGDRVQEPQSVILVHNTTTTPKELKTYTDLAEKYKFEVTSLIVENRHGNKSVHDVPDDAMARMKDRFEVKL